MSLSIIAWQTRVLVRVQLTERSWLVLRQQQYAEEN